MISAKIRLTTDPVPRVEGLKRQLQKRGMARAVKASLPPVEQSVEDLAPEQFGFLRQSIGIRVKTYRNAVAGIVGPKSKFRRRKGVYSRGKHKGEPIWHRPAFYATLVERGTKRARPSHFLTRALSQTKERYLVEVGDRIAEEIASALHS